LLAQGSKLARSDPQPDGALRFITRATSQPVVLAGIDRITFTGSVREVATIQGQFASSVSGTLVRSELAPAEAQASLDFSVVLKMHNFAELQQRTSKGQTISLDEMEHRRSNAHAQFDMPSIRVYIRLSMFIRVSLPHAFPEPSS
jgi:hypothetical protein